MMNTYHNHQIRRGLAVVLLLAACGSSAALARATAPSGSFGGSGGLEGVWGHIDIPEIGRITSPGFTFGSTDPNVGTIGAEDLDEIKRSPIVVHLPADSPFPSFTGSNDPGSPELFPPSDTSVGFVPSIPGFGIQDPLVRGASGATAPVFPVFNIPAPGVPLLLLTAAGIVTGRRRRW